MQRNTTKFGVVVVANSSCLHLDLALCRSFSFDVVSVSLCHMHMYMHGKGRHACELELAKLTGSGMTLAPFPAASLMKLPARWRLVGLSTPTASWTRARRSPESLSMASQQLPNVITQYSNLLR